MAADKVQKIVDAIKELSVVEAFELKKALETEFDVQAAAPMAMMAAPMAAGAAAEEEGEEQSEFSVVLTDAGAEKIGIIKIVKAATGLGLKEAKDLVDAAPKEVMAGLSKEKATELVKELTDAGAKAEMK